MVVDNTGKTHNQVYFGATVTWPYESGEERAVTIVGVDELDLGRHPGVVALAVGQGALEGLGRATPSRFARQAVPSVSRSRHPLRRPAIAMRRRPKVWQEIKSPGATNS